MQYEMAERLDFSYGQRLTSDIATLKAWIPGCVSVEKTCAEVDRTGVDYVATLAKGARIGIDGKARDAGASRYWQRWPDGRLIEELALEVWSVMPGGKYDTPREQQKVGWTLSQRSDVDLILFTFDAKDSDQAYLLPFQPLRIAFEQCGRDWFRKYKSDTQDSQRWESRCVFVPAPEVLRALFVAAARKRVS